MVLPVNVPLATQVARAVKVSQREFNFVDFFYDRVTHACIHVFSF